MINLKPSVLAVACVFTAPLFALAGEPVNAMSVAPEQQGEYTFQPTLSIVSGVFDQSVIDTGSGKIFGAELGLNSLIRLASDGYLRHVFGLGVNSVQGSASGYDGFRVLSVELNTYYMTPVNEAVHVGVGAGLGYVRIKQDALNNSYSASSAQFGVALDYQKDRWVFGAELRHQLTGELELERVSTGVGAQSGLSQDVDLPNTRLLLKVGYSFTP